jgi:hypothetical protein
MHANEICDGILESAVLVLSLVCMLASAVLLLLLFSARLQERKKGWKLKQND